jgi:hypothetical protein
VYVENVCIVNTGYQRLQKFDNNDNFTTKLGPKDTGRGQFKSTISIAVYPKINKDFVVDSNDTLFKDFLFKLAE